MPARNQQELVQEEQGFQPKEVTRKITLPGLETLHTKTIDEIAEVLAIAIKSEPNVVELRYRAGKFIELTTANPE